jgi:putative DNA methylase
MFAGGGAIPLEATRLGCEAAALELNPVAHLIELCTLDYPQRFGPSLADDVRRWGKWLIDRAKSEVGSLYPEIASADAAQTTIAGTTEPARRVPIAYLWTRTVPCPNPAARAHTAPLVRQTWLVKKRNRFAALRIVPHRDTMTLSYEVVEAQREDALGFDPAGFSRRGASTCPLCGASIELDYVKQQGREGRMGVELMAVALVDPSARGKTYIGSEDGLKLLPDEERLARMLSDLADSGFTPPAEPICAQDNQAFLVPAYGITRFQDLFTRRQLVMLLTLCRLAQEAHAEMGSGGMDAERAKAVATYLGMVIDRIADRSSTLCRWDSSASAEKTANTFARQALPMTWDFSEANPFGGASGDLAGQLEYVIAVVEHCSRAGTPVRVVRGSATDLPFGDAEFDAVITDPPYYDNVPYSDLSDFFYVWLKRSIGHIYPEHLAAEFTPKRSEIVASRYRNEGSRDAAKAAYEGMMAAAFSEARRVLRPEGVLVCVYAHQTTAGWSTLIEAVRQSGFVVVEAWPLDTEMSSRGRAQNSAALASSIFLVARPRIETRTGDWAHEVRPELQTIVSKRVGELAELEITGTDLIIAAIGAGMRAYTRYGRVEKPNGEELSPDEYLEEVEREVAEAVLERIFDTDRSGLGRVDQETQFYVMGRFEFGDALAPWDELNTLARGTGVELRELVNAGAPLVVFGAKRTEARISDYRDRGGAIELGRSTIDHLHRVLWLADNDPTMIRDYLELARPDSERLRLVAHALSRPGLNSSSARVAEADACERLLGVWKRLVEDNLFTAGGA